MINEGEYQTQAQTQTDQNMEDKYTHIIPSEGEQMPTLELKEEILAKMGFDYGDIEMLEMLKDIDPTKCNMDIIKQTYMDMLQGRTAETNIDFDVIIGTEGDTIFGTNIAKRGIANDVLTLLVNEINNPNPVGGNKVRRKRRGKTMRKTKTIRKIKKKRRTKKRRA
jgi:hypothetical protein